jgi:alanyl-tRNA synthetase
VSPDELAAIETEVNFFLRQNDETAIRLMARDEAIATGAMALFGEKYGDEVRVVTMGREPDGRITSVELCGGTHCRRTGDIALFKIVAESAVAAGIRRIEALTGEAALDYVRNEERLLAETAGALKVTAQELPERVVSLLAERRRLEQELSRLRQKAILADGGLQAQEASIAGTVTVGQKQVAGIAFVDRRVEGVPAKDLRGMADTMQQQVGSGVVALISVAEDGKAALVVSVSDDLKEGVNAVELVRVGVAELGGKGGGGRPDFAQGGGPDGARAEAALAAIEQSLARDPALAS